MKKVLISIKDLKKSYKGAQGTLFAVRGVSFEIYQGEILGLVGESGCGKSTVGKTLLRLHEPTGGNVFFNGKNLFSFDKLEMRKKMQMIFQDPFASLNPRMTVREILLEPLEIHKSGSKEERKIKVDQIVKQVGLEPSHLSRFPHEFSGGQRQRIGLARALVVEPEFIVCDEPLSALDVSIQAQIVNLLKNLQEKFNLTLLFIAHDLSVVKYISDRVAVMYLGELMELASSDELYQNPLHPYTQALLASIPIPDPKIEKNRSRILLKGEVPTPFSHIQGCPFASRCPLASEICTRSAPQWKEVKKDHFVACHLINASI